MQEALFATCTCKIVNNWVKLIFDICVPLIVCSLRYLPRPYSSSLHSCWIVGIFSLLFINLLLIGIITAFLLFAFLILVISFFFFLNWYFSFLCLDGFRLNFLLFSYNLNWSLFLCDWLLLCSNEYFLDNSSNWLNFFVMMYFFLLNVVMNFFSCGNNLFSNQCEFVVNMNWRCR